TIYQPVVDQILPIPFTPDGDGGVRAEVSERAFLDVVREQLGIGDLRVVATGGDEFESERNQWDAGNNVIALAPGVVIGYDRNERALMFEKDSTRTRCAFEVAAYDQGAPVTFMGPSGSHMGHKETVKDTARVLGRMYDSIEFRGFAQPAAEELAEWAGVPVFN